ncbi:PREDICTED: venom carboxylesterase-6-like [Nicrophorus vespilloides]|uniref:Carboxylic ester hydrolase n=1 Tax=Nicrophorus vespilloides TaxID=110193 RepID=A0ABM1MCK4_NICVS|nr:PREDICTED: venom carboxylesterase-6-like [Nicrophorus vespilloides]
MVLIVVILFFALSASGEDSPIVETENGPIVGIKVRSRAGELFYSFRGVPYAKPPLGNLRFRSPEKPDNWTGIYDARDEGPKCVQKIWYSKLEDPPVEGVEDCLYINIYTRVNAYIFIRFNNIAYSQSLSLSDNYPVMVYIHQGGFTLDSGQSTNVGPDYLLDEEIVLVTFNYRLGIMGFFSTVDDASPGNYGYKDMIFVLRWVQENIKQFGGNKDKVTIFGQSAGGAAVHHLILSPSGKNLFHRAISESGTALNIWGYPFDDLQKDVARRQAKFVNCTMEDNFAMVECLRQVPAAELIDSAKGFNYFSFEPTTIFSSVTEIKTDSNPEPFITKAPMEIVLSGDFNQVPWITGITSDDGMVKASSLVRKSHTLKSASEKNEDYLCNELIDFYLDGQHFINVNNTRNVQQLINLYTDRGFAYGAYQSVLLQSRKSLNPIWLYNFNYRGKFTYGDVFAATNENIDFQWGVCHCDELLYLFTTSDYFPPLLEEDLKMSKLLVKLWTNFAKFGYESRR